MHDSLSPEQGERRIDGGDLRRVLGRFVTGVTLVTYQYEGKPYGMTANAFTSVSLDPPLVLVSVDRRADSHDRISKSRAFAVNILAESQEPIAVRFAGAHRALADPFDGIPDTSGETGSPILSGALGWLDCRLYATHDGGDHTLFLGQVLALGRNSHEAPLVFYAGGFRKLGEDQLTDVVWAWDVLQS
jgi:flavin reductase (DIM6/NTAB) family NADH-FMN oxidoreductase RutF